MELPLTEAAIIQRLSSDFSYFASAALKLIDKSNNEVPFTLNKAQQMLEETIRSLEAENKPVRIIVVKARQLGCSTMISGRMLWKCSTKKNQAALIVAHEVDAAQGLLAKVQSFYDSLPDVLRPTKKYRTKTELFFEGLNSNFEVKTANTPTLGRSRTYTHVHLSEAAFYGSAGEKALLSVMQAVPNKPGTMVILESTAQGMDNAFYTEVDRALKGESEYKIVFIPWFVDTDYQIGDETSFELDPAEKDLKKDQKLTYAQLRWRRYAIKNLCQGSEELFQQEYPSSVHEAFLYSGHPCFNVTELTRMRQQCPTPQFAGRVDMMKDEFILERPEEIKIWEYPKKGGVYILGIDTAEGIEDKQLDRDYSVIQVIDAVTHEQVAVYRSRVSVDIFPYIILKIAKFYNEAYLVPERNNHGLAVISKLRDLRYYKIYKQLNHSKRTEERTEKIGFVTTRSTKPMIVSNLAELIREGQLELNDPTTLMEMSKFSQAPDGRIGATIGHDDTVMALALAYWGLRYAPVQAAISRANPLKFRTKWTYNELKNFEANSEDAWVKENILEN